jgi:VWFA-related protein
MVNSNRKSRIGNRQSMRQSSIANVAMYGAAFVVLAAPLSAQQPTFRTGTTLIEFTLVAVDVEGRPVTDLTKDDLVLTEGGDVREIAFFRFDGDAPAVPDVPRRPPSGFVTNRHEPERNVTAIVLDMLNVDPAGGYGQTSVRGLILRYLDTLPTNTRAGLFRFSDLNPIVTLQTFTDRIDLVRSKVISLDLAVRGTYTTSGIRSGAGTRTAEGRAAMGSMEAAESRQLPAMNQGIHRTRLTKTLRALEALGSHLAGIPGRKSVIWITNAPAIKFNDLSYEPQIRQAAQRLANQGIAVYPVAPGLTAGDEYRETDLSTFSVFASVTGGRRIGNTNDLSTGVVVAARDQRGTYTLGFYASDEPDDQWRPLQVSVKREGVRLRSRQGYLAVRRAHPQSWPSKSWNDLMNQPLDATAIRLNARGEVTGGDLTLSLEIEAADLYFHGNDGRVIADLEIGVAEKTRSGFANVRVQPMEVTLEGPPNERRSPLIPVKSMWPIRSGVSSVRVTVRDRFTGKYGTLEVPVGR